MAPSAALAQSPEGAGTDDVVVTASIIGEGVPRDLIGGSITTLSADDLEQRGTRQLADVLRDVPGVEVSRSGCLGCTTQVRLRGAEANHTLVLVDGIDLASPVSREADFSTMLGEDGARVEVLRGQQSALYGSQAIGGVIQYFTPDGRTSPGVRARLEYGSFNTFSGNLQAGGSSGKADYIASFTAYDSDGTTDTRTGTRDLGYWNYTLSGKAHYAFSDTVRLFGVVRWNRNRSDFNSGSDSDGALIDTPGNYATAENLVGRLALQVDALGGRWSNNLSVEGLDARSSSYSFGSPYTSRGTRVKTAFVTAIAFGDDHIKHKLTASVDYQHETFEQVYDAARHDLDTIGLVGVYDLVVDEDTAFSASVRNDSNNRFKSFTSYRVQATHSFPTGTRLRAAAGSGIQYPTQFELFGYSGTFLANPGLRPEKSEGWEAGIEQKLLGKAILIGATYFSNVLTDKISSMGFPVSTPVNLAGRAHQKGVEAFANIHLADGLAIDAAYTYLDSTDGVPPTQTVRRARNIASANVNWSAPGDRLRLNLNVRYNGSQFDNAFPPAPPYQVLERLAPYTVVNVNAEYRLGEKFTLFVRADNLFDERYEEVWSYVAPGRLVSGGVKARF
ncbi:TonB-dependent receptor [Sphingomonas sp. CL5.1]|uniref:TonB-dependent receptor plug domain-containing protein n=1 Tax=Sphingomonas sp. CL5.1 TaxID=2653203 RepID=UPI001583B187|nr:TonB-dependent receptor [Sphingomonas sp. CL5.1]QKS01195.1 TonB-dependent receptor [Sphingomonas sp. CL5.1]